MARPPKQHSLWDRLGRPGQQRKYLNADELWSRCCDYFEWAEKNPVMQEKAHVCGGAIEYSSIAIPRPLTKDGLYKFLGICQVTWEYYRKDEMFEDGAMSAVCKAVEQIIREQKITHATAGLYNPAIVMRELGMVDKQDIHSSGTVTQVQYTAEDYKRAQADLSDKLGDLD